MRATLELAEVYYEDCLAEYRRLDDQYGVADALNWLGVLAFSNGDYDRATTYYEEHLAVRRQLHDRQMTSYALFNLAETRHHQGDLDGARHATTRSYPSSVNSATRRPRPKRSGRSAGSPCSRATASRLRRLLREGLSMAEELGNKGLVASCLQDLAGAAGAAGDGIRAARLLGAASKPSAMAIGAPLQPAYRGDHDRYVSRRPRRHGPCDLHRRLGGGTLTPAGPGDRRSRRDPADPNVSQPDLPASSRAASDACGTTDRDPDRSRSSLRSDCR